MNSSDKSITYKASQQKGHCGYCDTQNSVTIGFSTKSMTSKVYQQLIDRGWRKCGTYFYANNCALTCCLIYTIRLNVEGYKERKAHRKAAKKLMQFLSSPLLLDQSKTIKQLIDNYSYQTKQCLPKKQSSQKSIKSDKNIKLQQTSTQSMQSEGQTDQIKAIFVSVINEIQKDDFKNRLISSLKAYFVQENYLDSTQLIDILLIDDQIPNQCKIFTSKETQKEKGDYYSNFIMLIYGRNKKTLFQKLSVEQFCAQTNHLFLDILAKHNDYLFAIDKSGYLCIFNPEKKLLQQKQVQKLEQKFIQPDQPNMKIEISQNQEKPPTKLITYDANNWLSNKFNVGNMQIILKKAGVDQEAHELYQKYCQVIHGKADKSVQSYKGFLCENSIDGQIKKSQVDNKTLLFLGCYHMCYYLQDKLIAVGVVDILEETLSSVYFFYHPMFEEKFQFGKFGSLVEIEYINIMRNYFPDFKYYYLGFYIQACQKMSYKAEFGPCELLCPVTFTWVDLDKNLINEIDYRNLQTINKRKVRLAKDHIQVIDDLRQVIVTINQY